MARCRATVAQLLFELDHRAISFRRFCISMIAAKRLNNA